MEDEVTVFVWSRFAANYDACEVGGTFTMEQTAFCQLFISRLFRDDVFHVKGGLVITRV